MEEQKQEPTTLEQIQDVWQRWIDDPRFEAEDGMEMVSDILVEDERREQRLKTIAEIARRDRELAERDAGVQS